MNSHNHKPHTNNHDSPTLSLSLSLSRKRKRKLALRRTLIISTLILAVAIIITPPLVGSVQNIFVGLHKVTSIWYNGQQISKVVYEGQTIWERALDGTMQGTTHTNCPASPTPVKDTRDGRYYRIQRLADGRCWMLTNLAYTSSDAGQALYYGAGQSDTGDVAASNTNWNRRTPPYNNQKQFTGAGSDLNIGVTLASGTRCATTYRTNPSLLDSTECGILYNWCAALGNASGQCGITGPTSGYYTNIAAGGTGICPAGWRLPTRDEYELLKTSVGGNVGFRNALYTMTSRSGEFSAGTGLVDVGVSGGFWTSTPYDNITAAHVYLYNGANSHKDKHLGENIRCVLGTPLLHDGYIQNATATNCEVTTLGATVRLKDQRDGKTYRVRKMADNHCWMIDNLAYDLTGATTTGKPSYTPRVELVSDNDTSVNNGAQYALNPNYTIPNNGSATPSYLYNWCAAMADTSSYCGTSLTYGANQPSTPQTGICPSPFRLPTGGSNGEFRTLNQAVNSGSSTSPQGLISNWLGVYSGRYRDRLQYQGDSGSYWSATATSGASAYMLDFSATSVTSWGINTIKEASLAVRCVL